MPSRGTGGRTGPAGRSTDGGRHHLRTIFHAGGSCRRGAVRRGGPTGRAAASDAEGSIHRGSRRGCGAYGRHPRMWAGYRAGRSNTTPCPQCCEAGNFGGRPVNSTTSSVASTRLRTRLGPSRAEPTPPAEAWGGVTSSGAAQSSRGCGMAGHALRATADVDACAPACLRAERVEARHLPALHVWQTCLCSRHGPAPERSGARLVG